MTAGEDWKNLLGPHEELVVYPPHNHLSDDAVLVLKDKGRQGGRKGAACFSEAQWYLSRADWASWRLGQERFVVERVLPKLRADLGARVSLSGWEQTLWGPRE